MPLGICGICKESQAKYKCPKCVIEYCSLRCFKSPNHTHDDVEEQDKNTEDVSEPNTNLEDSDYAVDDKYKTLMDDKELRYLLNFKALRIHLSNIFEILNDSKLDTEKKYELANKKLSGLRISGNEENSLVEEFCERVITLLKPN